MPAEIESDPSETAGYNSRVDYKKIAVWGAVMAPAIAIRIIALRQAIPRPLENDAMSFLKLASNPVTLWSASRREPFFIILHRLALLSADGQPWAIRIQSMVFSIVLVGIITAIALRLFKNRWTAALPGLLLALTPFIAFQATRGMRLEIFLSLSLALTFLLCLSTSPLSWRKAAVAGAVAAAVCLTRQVGILVVLAVLGVTMIKLGEKYGLKQTAQKLAVTFSAAFVLSAPFYYNQHREYQNAFYINTYDATFWRNQEFRDRPGFPSSEELKIDPRAGQRVTGYEYVAGMHSFKQIIARLIKGYVLTFTFFFKHALGPLWWMLFLAAPGAAVICARGHWEWAALFVIMLAPFAFIIPLSVVGHSSVDARFAMHGFPLAALFMGAGFDWLVNIIRKTRMPADNEKTKKDGDSGGGVVGDDSTEGALHSGPGSARIK
jgi:hypothetical protein